MGDAAEQLTKVPTLTRALRVELVRPLDVTWDVAGAMLRSRRAVMHRLLNAAIASHIAADHMGLGGDAKRLEAIRRELEEIREWGAKNGREDMASLNLASAVTDALQMKARQMWQKYLKDRRQTKIPSFGAGAPIFIRDGGWDLSRDARGFVLGVRLTEGRTGMTRFAIAGSHGKHWETLRTLHDAGAKLGDCKIVYDDERRKWYALLAYTTPAPIAPPCDPDAVLVLHRGVYNFLTAMSSTGQFAIVDRGNKLLAQKRQFAARTRSAKTAAGAGSLGTGGRGHGRGRRYESYSMLEDKLARIIDTTCKTTAARALTLARQWGCGTVVIEEYGGIEPDDDRGARRFITRFPFAQLKGSVAWACKRDGFSVREVPSFYVSTTCPRCGNQDSAQVNHHGTFKCRRCEFTRGADFVAALHMLRAAKPDGTAWDEKLRIEADFARSLKECSRPVAGTEVEGELGATASPEREGLAAREGGSRAHHQSASRALLDIPPSASASASVRERLPKGGAKKTRKKTTARKAARKGAR